MLVLQKSLGVASAKPVPFLSTLKKAGGVGPQRGSKREEVTPLPGGGGAGGEVRKKPKTRTITRRAKSTRALLSSPCLSVTPQMCALTSVDEPPDACTVSTLHGPAHPA